MPFLTTNIAGLTVFEPKIFKDDRGYFYESYNANTFRAAGIDAAFVQDNQSKSEKNVLRGLHYQVGEFAQAKLVRVLEGAVLDIAVDIRPNSPTYGHWFSILLSEENQRQLFIPRGFAHGFAVMSPTATFFYKCDNFYSKDHEFGLIFDDPTLKIDWQMDIDMAVLSEKDKLQPKFGQHVAFY